MRILLGLALIAGAIGANFAHAGDARVTFEDGDRVVFMGNTFAERLREYNYFETLLASAYPEKNLTFRNLAWSADEITLRPRPLDFGDIHTHLANQKADVIFLCYGANESFAGEAGLSQFRRDLGEFLRSMLARRYNGETRPKLVLVSPIPQEPIEAKPDVVSRNVEIAAYASAMRQVATAYDVTYVDLFGALTKLSQSGSHPPLTFNGVHLHNYGAWVVSHVMMNELNLSSASTDVSIDAQAETGDTSAGVLSNIARDQSAIRFDMAWGHLLSPSLPGYAVVPGGLAPIHPVIRVTNLDPGTYRLTRDGVDVVTASHTDWAKGVVIYDDETWPLVEQLRELIDEKNQLFFDRYRAINGYYIYGGRKEPFGVVSFPPEMSRFDELVAELDGKIHEHSQPPAAESYELNPVGE